MTRKVEDRNALKALMDNALDLLETYQGTGLATLEQVPKLSLPSLLEQCKQAQVSAAALDHEPMRVLHHMACTGGTLIAKCIAVLPNVQLLSEIDPLSSLGVDLDHPKFAPTDILRLAQYSVRPPSDDTRQKIFMAALDALRIENERIGQRTVLRDHAHSHFCHGHEVPDRPSLHDMLVARYDLRSIVTVRHPIESFFSLQRNKWLHFKPQTLDEYARRYLLFLDHHTHLPVFKYEDFVEDPAAQFKRMCESLELQFDGMALEMFHAAKLTGDSGRSGMVIRPRAPRSMPPALREAAEKSSNYSLLCQTLGYDRRNNAG